MKQVKKNFNLILTIAMLIFAIVCAINVSYSYFSSVAQVGGSTEINSLDVRFVYKEKNQDGSAGPLSTKDTNTLMLTSSVDKIENGVEFSLSLADSGVELYELGIQSRSNSTSSYVRFWIDAYVMDGSVPDKTVNYGKYFLLGSVGDYTKEDSSSSTSNCYYVKSKVNTSDLGLVSLGSTLKLSDLDDSPVPVEITGENLQISVSFEAVQSENGAFKTVFDDEKGYYNLWS